MFTKNINEILNVYCDICKEKGIPKIDASFTHIGSVISLNSVIADSRKILQASIDRRKKRYEYTKLVNLPNLIFNHENIFTFMSLIQHQIILRRKALLQILLK